MFSPQTNNRFKAQVSSKSNMKSLKKMNRKRLKNQYLSQVLSNRNNKINENHLSRLPLQIRAHHHQNQNDKLKNRMINNWLAKDLFENLVRGQIKAKASVNLNHKAINSHQVNHKHQTNNMNHRVKFLILKKGMKRVIKINKVLLKNNQKNHPESIKNQKKRNIKKNLKKNESL